MLISKATLKDLSFTGHETEGNLLNLIDRCNTYVGRNILLKQISKSPNNFELLIAQQNVIRFWVEHPQYWSSEISNGTIVMLDKFFESADSYSSQPSGLLSGKLFQKIFNRNEYHFTQFSLSHLSDFLKGCQAFTNILQQEKELPQMLFDTLTEMATLLEHRLSKAIININKNSPFKIVAQLSFHARREMKSCVHQLIQLYASLDVWHGMATASREHNWQFPTIVNQNKVCLFANGLYHPLLKDAVRYNLSFTEGANFMMLTGANMSGKTTLMRALGISAILAHLGMAVPADEMTISYLDSVITNMHVEDDLLKGESFFLAEVKSMKHTAESIAQNNAQLVLMDELFKGTNVHDACECTKAIVEGLLQHPNNLMILSTHLHEVAHHFEHHKGLVFYCFHTTLSQEGNFEFNYQLQPGISDERIGYRILVKEGIVSILNKKS